jgi:TRAP-type C4-dicarboxylate transport system, large permease component
MKNITGQRAPGCDCGIQRRSGEARINVATQTITYDLARLGIENDGQIGEAGADRDVGDVPDPELIRSMHLETVRNIGVNRAVMAAVVVPPSIVLVVYGVLTETSIGKLFIAGIIPGLLTATGLAVVIKLIAHTTDQAPKGDPFKFKRAVKSSCHVFPMILLMILVIGAIYGGIASPSEAAALGVMGSLIIVIFQRTMSFVNFNRCVSGAIRATVMIVAIVACSAIFSNYLAFTRITHRLLEFVATTEMSRGTIMAIMILTLLIMFMDQLAILSLAMPLAFPTAMALDFDPIWFGIVVTKTVEIGLLTPPLGLNAHVAAAQTGVPLSKIFRGILPFLGMEILVLLLLIFFPQITLWLPSLMLR